MTVRIILIIVASLLVAGVIACGSRGDSSNGASGSADDDTAADHETDDDIVSADDDNPSPDDDTAADDDTADDDDDEEIPEPDFDTDFEGFGRDATGGEGGTVVSVTSLSDDGAGTLREAVENADGPVIVRFDVDGVIDLEHVLDLPSDITLDARGRDVTIKTNGLRLDGVSNIVVMNIAFQDVAGETGDAIQILNGASDIVIFHCAFDSAGLMPFVEDVPDELISVVWGATNITVSWCRFSNHDKVLLFGNGDAPPETDEAIAVTLHHNVFTETGRRHPFLRYGRVDMYNNIVRDWTMYLRWPYGTRSEADAQILLEANWYEQSAPWFFVGAYHKSGGAIRLVDNVTTGSWIALWEAEPDAVFHRDYPAPIDLPTPAWYAMLDTYAGNTMPAP